MQLNFAVLKISSSHNMAVLYSAPPIPAGIHSFQWNQAVLYPPRVIPYGIHGMEGGIHEMSDGFHGMSDGFHGISRWIPYHFEVDSMEW
jgi:hypothetical protein